MSGESRAYTLADADGQAYWFTGTLMILKATGEQTEGRFFLLDQTVPGNYAVPWHVHHHEDEAWYLLEGDVAFYCGERRLVDLSAQGRASRLHHLLNGCEITHPECSCDVC